MVTKKNTKKEGCIICGKLISFNLLPRKGDIQYEKKVLHLKESLNTILVIAQLGGKDTNNDNADYYYFADDTVLDKAETMLRLPLDRNLRPGSEKLFRV